MNSGDKIKVTGVFHCKVFKHGELVKEYTSNNMVVQGGLDFIAKKFSDLTTTVTLDKIGVGTSSTDPSLSDTNLTATVFDKAFDSVTFVSPGKIEFAWTIDPSEANGITIAEFGLLFTDKKLFARLTGLTVAKDASTSLAGTWTISIT